jgi:signal transduction histidine kinase
MLTAIVALGEHAEQIKAQPLRLGEGIVGVVALTGIAEMVADTKLDPRSKQIPDTPEEHEALLCAPLLSKGNVLGVMSVARGSPQPPFERLDFEFFVALAAQAAIAIENARLYDVEHQRAVELGDALTQQQELDRLKNAFIQNVSHELRTPLAIIRGYAELLTSGDLGDLTEQQQESVAVMARRARMLSKMLDDLLAILAAETHKLEKELVDLAAMVQLVVTDFQAPAKQAGVTLTAAVAPGAPPVLADSIHLRRVLDNLLGNALKFTPQDGRVSVTLTHTSQEVVLEVSDTGIGIAPDHLPKIFQRFYQADSGSKRRFGGVGLGLALVKEIVESHDGMVEVSSTLGAGTTFHIVLPAAPSPATAQLSEAA